MTGVVAQESTETTVPQRRRRWPSSQPVAFYLLALVLVILLPALLVALVLLSNNNRAQEEVVSGLTNATVQAIGLSVDREIAGMTTTLRVLSTSRDLVESDFAAFHQRARIALAGTGAYMLVLDRQFQQILNTRLRYGDPLGLTSDPASAVQALERGTATVSGLFFGRTADQWVFNVLVPVPDNREAALLVLTRNASSLASVLQTRQLPAGWHAALVDSNNLVIAATPDTGMATGTVLPMRQAKSEAASEWRRERLDGETVVTAEWASGQSGWRVIAWASVGTFQRPLGESLMWLAAWSIVIAALAGLLALLITQRVGRSVRGLRRDAQRLGSGELVDAKAYPVTEIAEVSQALAEASIKRQSAENEVHFLMREL